MVFFGKGEQSGVTIRRGATARWTQIHLLNNIKRGTWKGESAAAFDFVYVLEIASPLQLAQCSVCGCVFVCT